VAPDRVQTADSRPADELVVISMCSDPEPKETTIDVNGECPVSSADPYGPIPTDFLEVK